MALSKVYMQFLEPNSTNKLHKKLRDIVNRNDALEDLIKSPDDLIHLVKSYINDKGETLPGLENLIKFFREKMKPCVIARLFRDNNRNDDEIIKFINEHQSLRYNTWYVMPFKIEKIGEDTFLCYRKGTPSGSKNLVKLTPHPINQKQDDQPSRPSVIMYAERPNGQQPETSEQADMNTGVQSIAPPANAKQGNQPLKLSNYPLLTSLLNEPDDQPLDLRVAKKRKIEEVSIEETTLKRRIC